MGFFSYITCEGHSIANVHSGQPVKTVYLLQPNGEPALPESAYEGYGVFSNKCVFEWLSEKNFGVTSRSLGVMADVGSFYSDSEHYYFCSLHLNPSDIDAIKGQLDPAKRVVFFGNFGEKIAEIGLNMNELVEQGLVKKECLEVRYPLKFSLSPDTDYDSAPAADQCEAQGYFY